MYRVRGDRAALVRTNRIVEVKRRIIMIDMIGTEVEMYALYIVGRRAENENGTQTPLV